MRDLDLDTTTPAARARLQTIALAAAVYGACGGPPAPKTPDAALERFTVALRAERYAKAYALMSPDYRRRVSLEEFRNHLRNHPDEVDNVTEQLANRSAPPEVTASVALGEGETLELVRDDGEWRLLGNVVNFYDQSTPRAALRSFIRAMERRRYEVVMRFVPEADRKGMSVEQMRKAWEDEGRKEIERLLAKLRSHVEDPIEVVGDRATMPYGERFSVQFVREDGVWKIEDPD